MCTSHFQTTYILYFMINLQTEGMREKSVCQGLLVLLTDARWADILRSVFSKQGAASAEWFFAHLVDTFSIAAY